MKKMKNAEWEENISGLDESLENVAHRFDRQIRLTTPLPEFSAQYDKFYMAVSSGSFISTRRMGALTKVVLKKYGELNPEAAFSDGEIDMLCRAAVLHDIGKLAIKPTILKKPERLFPEEADLMHKHTEFGNEIVSRSSKISSGRFSQYFRDVCFMHHERYDGSGYPRGLIGDEIPVYVQLISAIDAYDALVSMRLYKPTYSAEMALEMISNGECGAFSPIVVETFTAASEQMKAVLAEIPYEQGGKQKNVFAGIKQLTALALAALFVFMSALAVAGAFLIYYATDEGLQPIGWSALPWDTLVAIFCVSVELLFLIIALWVVLKAVRMTRLARVTTSQFETMRRLYVFAESRSAVIMAQNNQIVFEYDFETRVVHQESAVARLYAIPESYRLNLDKDAVVSLIHEEDLPAYQDMWRQICGGKKRAECTVRVQNTQGKFVWLRWILQNIYDDKMQAVRTIGFAENVDDSLSSAAKASIPVMRDTFTGAYNKHYTSILVNRMMKTAENRQDAFLILDLDAFKKINDNFGHAAGDIIIKNFAILLMGSCRGKDFVGRIGGDEFVYYLYDIESKANALIAAKRLLDSMGAIGGSRLRVACSIGISFAPDEGKSFETLYEVADKNLYQAKRAGGNRYVCNAFDELKHGELKYHDGE